MLCVYYFSAFISFSARFHIQILYDPIPFNRFLVQIIITEKNFSIITIIIIISSIIVA